MKRSDYFLLHLVRKVLQSDLKNIIARRYICIGNIIPQTILTPFVIRTYQPVFYLTTANMQKVICRETDRKHILQIIQFNPVGIGKGLI